MGQGQWSDLTVHVNILIGTIKRLMCMLPSYLIQRVGAKTYDSCYAADSNNNVSCHWKNKSTALLIIKTFSSANKYDVTSIISPQVVHSLARGPVMQLTGRHSFVSALRLIKSSALFGYVPLVSASQG